MSFHSSFVFFSIFLQEVRSVPSCNTLSNSFLCVRWCFTAVEQVDWRPWWRLTCTACSEMPFAEKCKLQSLTWILDVCKPPAVTAAAGGARSHIRLSELLNTTKWHRPSVLIWVGVCDKVRCCGCSWCLIMCQERLRHGVTWWLHTELQHLWLYFRHLLDV